ncbi:TIGR00153 family protein [candidate division KSB1 bacterium]|nr:TIGR00153 family protein [candidate division KSB1 bacterium]
MFTSKKEKTVREKVQSHFDQTGQCLEATHETFMAFLAGQMDKAEVAYDRVEQTERAGDQLRREIYRLLGEGAFLPILRADLHKIVALVDDLAGLAEDFSDMIMGEQPTLPAEFHGAFTDIFKRTLEQFDDLKELMQDYFSDAARSANTLNEKINHVSRMEHEIDQIEWEITVSLFGSRLSLAEKLHLKQLLTQLSRLSNRIEDIGDTLAELLVKLQV